MTPTRSPARVNGSESSRTQGAVRSKASATAPRDDADRGVLIARVIDEVQKALQRARANPAFSTFPKFKAATLTLQTVVTRTKGGQIKLWIFSFGKSWEKELSHELVLELTSPPPAADRTPGEPTLADDLEVALVEAAQGVQNAGSGDPPLSLKDFKVTISFVVTEDGSGGVNGFKIGPVTLDMKGELKTKALHTIELEFERGESE